MRAPAAAAAPRGSARPRRRRRHDSRPAATTTASSSSSSPFHLLSIVMMVLCLCAAADAFRLMPTAPKATTNTALCAERVTAPPSSSSTANNNHGNNGMRSAPSARPYQPRRPHHQQHQNLHGGGGLREINNGINFWGKQRDFDMVLSLVARVEAEGLRPNIYTFHALLNAAVLCHRGEAETRQVWETMTQQHGIKPTAVTYNILLKRFFGHRSPVAQRQALALLDEMRHEGVEPDVLTFNELINICVEGGDMKAATNLLTGMLHRGLRPDATTYTTLIKGYGLKGNLVSAFDTVKEMRAQAVAMTTYSCNVLADACIRCGQPARALKLYRDFEAASAQEGRGGHVSSLDLKSFNIMLKAHREMGQLEGALGTLAAMKARGLEPDFVTYNTLVDAYCKAQKPQGARALVSEMKAGKVPVTHQTLHPLLQEEITSRGASLEQALVLAKEVLEEHGHAPSDVTVCTVMEAMLAMERPGDAIQVFLRSFALEEGEEKAAAATTTTNKPSLVAYNGLIKAYREYVLGLDLEGEAGDMPSITLLAFTPDGVPPKLVEATSPTAVLQAILPMPAYLRASQNTEKGNKGPDSITYNVLMDFAAELGEVEALERIHQDRTAAGFAMDHYVAHSYMKVHATRGNLAGVTEAKEKMEAMRVPPNERTFSVLVLSLLRCGQVDKADLLLKNALSRHLYVHDSLFMAFIQHHMATQPPSLSAAREIFEAFKTRRVASSSSSSTSSTPPPPVLLGQQHGKWTVSVWNAWMGALARTGDLPAVLAVWEEMTSPAVGLRPTMSSYAQVVHAACEARDVEAALEWVGRMKARRFMPDIRVYNQLIYACLEKEDGVKHLSEVLGMMEREGVQPNAITLRAKHSIMRVLASRMRSVSDSFLGKLKMLALSQQLGGSGAEGRER